MTRIKVWDPFVRIFHWSLVGLFAANALVIDGEEKLHHLAGYAIAALVLARVVWGVIGTRHARFSDFPPSLAGALDQVSEMATGRTPRHLGHTALGALMIYNLLATLSVIALSGWLMTTDAFWGVQWPETLHEGAVNWAEFSALLHILAVIVESLRTRVNLPRAMISGYKEFRDTGVKSR